MMLSKEQLLLKKHLLNSMEEGSFAREHLKYDLFYEENLMELLYLSFDDISSTLKKFPEINTEVEKQRTRINRFFQHPDKTEITKKLVNEVEKSFKTKVMEFTVEVKTEMGLDFPSTIHAAKNYISMTKRYKNKDLNISDKSSVLMSSMRVKMLSETNLKQTFNVFSTIMNPLDCLVRQANESRTLARDPKTLKLL